MSQETVAKAKTDIVNAGVSLSGNNGAFGITNLAAHRLGVGVVDKPNGNNAQVGGRFFSVDVIMARDGRAWDVLIDGGGTNVPVYNPIDPIDPSRYRDPVVDYPIKFDGPIVVDPGNGDILSRLDKVESRLKELSQLVSRTLDEAENLGDKVTSVHARFDQIGFQLEELNKFVHEEFNEVARKQNRSYRSIFGNITPVG